MVVILLGPRVRKSFGGSSREGLLERRVEDLAREERWGILEKLYYRLFRADTDLFGVGLEGKMGYIPGGRLYGIN